MPPGPAMDNRIDSGRRNSKLLRQTQRRFPGSVPSANLSDSLLRQLRGIRSLATSVVVSPLREHVVNILFLRSNKQMSGVYTSRHITFMQHTQIAVQGKSQHQMPHYSMDGIRCPINVNLTVSTSPSVPNPAASSCCQLLLCP